MHTLQVAAEQMTAEQWSRAAYAAAGFLLLFTFASIAQLKGRNGIAVTMGVAFVILGLLALIPGVII